MIVNDDEQIVESQDVSGGKPKSFNAGNTQVTVIHKPEAALEETKLKVLVELTVSGDNKDRSPVDLVTVLDVSRSMNKDNRIGKLKIAIQFLIRKLSPIDRLSVITFSTESKMLFPLLHITDESRESIIEDVNALVGIGSTNMAAGLEMGLKVLNERGLDGGRIGAIMFMSDGKQIIGDACQVQIDNFAVHTFGLGEDFDPKILNDIANKSAGGTFSVVLDPNDLTKAFSQCLGGLLTVVVQDLNLTITPVDNESKIDNVSAGNYPKAENNSSMIVSFGDLFNNEVRTIMVDLILPKVDSEKTQNVLQVTYTYSAGKEKRLLEGLPVNAIVSRTEKVTDKEITKVILEENRLKILNSVKEARVMADKDLDKAANKLVEAKTSLEDVKVDDPSQVFNILIYELNQMSEFMKGKKDYEEKGHPYAMSFESSHERQRYATRGDTDKVRSFATPRINAYHEQAKEFERDPTKPPPSVEDDVNKERVDDDDQKRIDVVEQEHIDDAKLNGTDNVQQERVNDVKQERTDNEQAKKFEKDPTMPPPSVEAVEEECIDEGGVNGVKQDYIDKQECVNVVEEEHIDDAKQKHIEVAKQERTDNIEQECIDDPRATYYIMIAFLVFKFVGKVVQWMNRRT